MDKSDASDAVTLLFTDLSRGKKVLLLLKIFTTWLLGLTILSMLIYYPVSIYLWTATFLTSSATILYGIHLWFSEDCQSEKGIEVKNVLAR